MSHDTSGASELAAIRPDEQFDQKKVAEYLRDKLPAAAGDPEVLQFPGGHSNLTYLIRFGDVEYVLRRPPLGPIAPKAHDMGREYRVLSKLSAVMPEAPKVYHFCEDVSILGAPFIVMERRKGIVIRNAWPPELPDTEELRRQISESLIDTFARMHTVDYVAAGLGDFGKPEGFVSRQVEGWAGRWERSKTSEVPIVDTMLAWLREKLPASKVASLIHNDYKLDNVMLDPANPSRISSIFDWEMSTIGDPLLDLGTTLAYWTHVAMPSQDGRRVVPTTLKGFMSREELLDRYAARTGFDLSVIGWHEAFALFKNAVVLQQIYYRFVKGQTKDKRFELLGMMVDPMIKKGMELAEKSGM